MRHEVKFETIVMESQIDKLRKFGSEFDHKLSDQSLSHPILVAKVDNEWKGYFQIIQKIPIVFPSIHPGKCKPMDTVEIMKAFQGWAKIQYGGGIVAVPIDSSTFTPEIMEKMFFKRNFQEIYETVN